MQRAACLPACMQTWGAPAGRQAGMHTACTPLNCNIAAVPGALQSHINPLGNWGSCLVLQVPQQLGHAPHPPRCGWHARRRRGGAAQGGWPAAGPPHSRQQHRRAWPAQQLTRVSHAPPAGTPPWSLLPPWPAGSSRVQQGPSWVSGADWGHCLCRLMQCVHIQHVVQSLPLQSGL